MALPSGSDVATSNACQNLPATQTSPVEPSVKP